MSERKFHLKDKYGNNLSAIIVDEADFLMQKQVVYVSSYPKSGSTWLTRLLADILDSPSGGCMPSEDSKEVATEGQDRPGPYIVRKGHFVLIDDDTGPVVPRPHRLAWRQLTDEKIVFLVRDPRDICVSGAHHWRQTPEQFLDRMIKGNVARCGRWDEFIGDYFVHLGMANDFIIAKYEDLLTGPSQELKIILKYLDYYMYHQEYLYEVIRRQSFATRKAQIGNDPKELRRNNMRKGIVGDWRNHFTPEMNDRIWDEFGWMMERLGYVKK
jgi:hypothetical protein